MATTQAPDFITQREQADAAWRSALARADAERKRYFLNLGYEDTGPSFAEQELMLRNGGDPNSMQIGSFRWTNNPYSQVQELMRQGGNEKQQMRDMFMRRGISGGLANQAASRVDYATGGQRRSFADRYADQIAAMRNAVSGARDSWKDARNTIDQAQAQWDLSHLLTQNPTGNSATPPLTGWQQGTPTALTPQQIQGNFSDQWVNRQSTSRRRRRRRGSTMTSNTMYDTLGG